MKDKIENPENFDDGLTRVAPKGQFKAVNDKIEDDFMTLKETDVCVRCKKNKATLIYTNSQMDFIHGFTEKICQECYDKQMRKSKWYKQGYKDGLNDGHDQNVDTIKEEMIKEFEKIIDEMLKYPMTMDAEAQLKVIKQKIGEIK